jgi:glycosyltransferase involved in cell wall biosynthesis
VVAVPSLEEGGNKVLLEAAAVGTPFVATDTTGNSDWARGWSCGVVVPSGSPAALAAGLRSVLEDPGSAAAMGRHGIRFAEFFRTRAVAERILALCGHAVQGGDLPPDLREPAGLRGAAEDPSPPPSSAGRP